MTTMSRNDTSITDYVLSYLLVAPGPMRPREIAKALGLRRSQQDELAKSISHLKRRRLIEELPGSRFQLSGAKQKRIAPGNPRAAETTRRDPTTAAIDRNRIVGRLVAHRDGYGFVVPDTPRPDLDGDLFIPPDQLGDAMHGDRVEARIEARSGRFAGGAARAEGRIVRVVNRAHATVVGIFHRGRHGNIVRPYESRILQEIVIPAGEERPLETRAKRTGPPAEHPEKFADLEGAVVDVEVTRFPRGGVAPAGRVIEVLGRPGDFGVDVEILIRKHHLPHRFPDQVLQEARRAEIPVGAAEIAGRRDFRDLPIVTIDGETARDFDDAVYVERRPGGWHLQVHIADVGHYVPMGSPLDREARLRGTSVYFPDRAVPMLPEELSSGICSLKPHEDRLVMSVLIDFDHDGVPTGTELTPGVIRSSERMTYTLVNAVLQSDPDATARYAGLAERFRAMRDLALVLNARRTGRGSMDFDLPERVLQFDAAGQIAGIVRSERNIAHRLIEEFMLAANQAVAQYLNRRGLPSLHRVHEKPDPKKVLEFEELARAFGYSLGVPGLAQRSVAVRHGRVQAPARGGRGHFQRGGGARERRMEVAVPAQDFQIRPQHYQRLTQKIAGKPEERILSYLMLRSLKQARYSVESLGHFALAFDEYTHFTSPIRRYPDLIVHRVLKWALDHPNADQKGMHGPYTRGELAAIALESSDAERRADGVERELMDWKTVQYMERHLGEEYDALIVSVQKFGFFVELMEVFVEGLVPINHLEEDTGEPCVYRERDHAIVSGRGSRARIWRLGDRLRVRADRIDPMRRRVEFALGG